MTRNRRPSPWFCVVVALAVPLRARAQEIRLGAEFQVNTYTTSRQRFPSVAEEADGDFVVVWESYGQDGGVEGVFGGRFSSAGALLANEFQVNTYTTGRQGSTRVAADADGDFVVAWQSNNQDGYQDGIFARRFSSAGVALAGEFQVNTFTIHYQRYAAVAADADGDFVVAWQSNTQDDGSFFGIFARRFSSAGVPLATEFQVNDYTTNEQSNASVAVSANGDFVVAWDSVYQDTSGRGIFAHRFSSAGSRLATEFQVNTNAAGSQGQPLDGNGLTLPLTDGLLILRRFFGFTGTTLTTGAVGAGCARCDAAAIEPYIAGLGPVLDVDGNTTIGALTDGLLALRFLFGFTGATLTTGAVGGGCSRCDAATIEPYLQGLQ